MMRITVNGVRVDASVKKTILPECWSAAKGKALEKKRQKIRATVNDLNGFVMDGWAWGLCLYHQ